MTPWFDRFFQLSARKTNVRTEIMAGITTFMTMGYIIFVNPEILSKTGMPIGPLLTTTCLAAALGTLLMALMANYPLALAPSMGLNAFFAFTVVIGMQISWEVALAAIFVEGVIFILLTLTRIRECVVNCIPASLKNAISAGVGMFIAFIGFQTGGIVVRSDATLVSLAKLGGNTPALLTLTGLFIIGIFESLRIRGGILWGILCTTLLAIFFGVAPLPEALLSAPPSIAPIFMKMDFSGVRFNFTDPQVLNFWIVVLTFFFVDFFDTVGTLVGAASRANLLDEKGCLPNARPALMADAIATTAGAMLGTSTVTTFVESTAGIGVGGRTGLTSIVTAGLFLLAMFFSPIVSIVPACATAPALIFVGVYMMMNVARINFDDWTELIPSTLAIFAMPFCYSIAAGIEIGIVSYAILKLCTGRAKAVSPAIWVLAAIFIAKELLL